MSRVKTKEEVRKKFIQYLKNIGNYWLNLEGKTTKEKMEGFLFSIYNIFDGTSCDMPAFDIIVRPHPDDKQYDIDNGENYYKDGMCINDDVLLHEIKGSSDLIQKNIKEK